MSNTSKGWGRKGSKFWMQMVACFPTLENEFIKQIAEEENSNVSEKAVEWISPRADKELEEYSLNSSGLEKILIVPKEFWKTWKSDEQLAFWTTRQPQWDGIAFCKKSGTLYLIEAKAHLSETYTEIAVNEGSEGSEKSFELRRASLQHTRKLYTKSGCEETWWGGKLVNKVKGDEKFYYQVGNRLAFLNFLNEKKADVRLMLDKKEYMVNAVKVVFLNFADDYTLNNDYNGRKLEATVSEWKKHYEQHIWPDMIGKKDAPNDVLVINYSVRDILPDLSFRKDADMKVVPSKTSSRKVREDQKAHNLFFYKIGMPEKPEDIDVPFMFKTVDGIMRCCARDTDTVISSLENRLGVK